MAPVRRVVIDVLKPHEPPMEPFARQVGEADTVEAVAASLVELDKEVQNVKLTFEGEDVDLDAVEAVVEELGGTVHSVDEVVCGDYVVEERRTHQD
jgi:hypothetical protein